MSVVRRDTRRRWAIVVAAVAVLVAIPLVVRALPAGATSIAPDTLAARIAASARQPYQGYAVSTGSAGLPSLPQLDDVIGLFDGNTSLRIWYADPGRWRVDTIDAAGERDLYQSGADQTIWDYGRNQLTDILGVASVRLPRGADLAPPDLARRLLSAASAPDLDGSVGSSRKPLPARRVAGIDAAGLRLTPTSAQTTVASVDIWAEPKTGLPLEVDVSARGVVRPVLVTRLLSVSLSAPATATTTVQTAPPGVGHTVTSNPDVVSALRNLGLGSLPDSLGGLARSGNGLGALPGLAAYGTGFRQVVAANVPRRTGFGAIRAARNVGGTVNRFAGGIDVIVTTPLLSVVITASDLTGNVYIVVGLVSGDVLAAAGVELATFVGADE
jgi:hypothetical protein